LAVNKRWHLDEPFRRPDVRRWTDSRPARQPYASAAGGSSGAAYEIAAVVPRLEDAMRLLDSESFDLAMLDVHLNGKTVFPFAAELEAREIPFLFATAYGPRGIPEEFRHHLVLQKPFGPVELRRALMELSGRVDA
jgi:two-component SAPR family response regulator